jgi:acyl dehydratase
MSAVDWSAPFEQLEPGQTFTTRGRTVTETDVVNFAALTGDWHPQHADAVWAAEGAFGERIAHGMLVISFAAGLVPFDPERVVALRRVQDAVFKRPVRFGDTVRVRGQLAAAKSMGEDAPAGLVTCAWNVVNQHEEIVCRAKVDVLWRTDVPQASPPKPNPEPKVESAVLTEPHASANGEFVGLPL